MNSLNASALPQGQPVNTYFTADLHFGHRAVIEYSHRPFASVEEMDNVLTHNWNSTVSPRDTVHIVGDCAFSKPDRAIEIFRSLNGRKHLVFGNHDKRLRKEPRFLELFETTTDLQTVKIQDADATDGVRRIVLCHYPMLVWDRSHYGAWHLHGHSHGSLPDDPHALRLDIGVDAWTSQIQLIDHEKREITRPIVKLYRPVSYDEIKARMLAKTWRPVDGHKERE